MSVITNTTVISNFACIEQLDMLRRLQAVIHISTEVYAELRQGQEEGCAFYTDIDELIYPFSAAGWIHPIGMAAEEEFRLFGGMGCRFFLFARKLKEIQQTACNSEQGYT